ncbi:MAG TPA: TonB-dependent receptor, partial [Rhodothermales bacterium]|nr:TonB-dependent receptor [Rhodothermales bacterium]
RRVSLAGFVLDAHSGEVLPGATVYLPDARRGATASSAGYFVVPEIPEGTYRVRASHVGYYALDTVLTAGATRTVLRLRPSRLEVPEVVVERGRELAAPPPGTTELTAAQLEAFPAPFGEQDLVRKLEWLPGVSRAGEALGGLVVRGGEPDENLYLLDDAPVYHPWHAFTLVSTFQAETVNRVRLYRGVFPAEYGGRLSSVVETEVRDGGVTRPAATVGLGLLAARYLVESPITRGSSFMIGGRRSYLDRLVGKQHVAKEGSRRDTLRTGYYFGDLTAKVTVRPGFRHRLSVSFYDGGDALDVRLPFELVFDPRALARAVARGSWRPADLYVDVDHAWGNRLVSARYQYLASPRLFLTSTAYHTAYRADERTILRPAEGTTVRAAYAVRLADAGMRADAELVVTPRLRGRVGVQAAVRAFESHLATETEQPTTTLRSSTLDLRGFEGAAYLQAHYQLNPGADVQAGLRAVSVAPGGYTYLLPNAALQVWLQPRRLVARLGAGAAVQPIHRLRDQSSLLYDLVAERWIPASERVRPGVGTHAAAGIEWRPARGLGVSLEAYARRARGVLMPDAAQAKETLDGSGVDLATLLGQYVRADAYGRGLEAVVQGQLGRWELYATYALERSERRPEGEARYQPSRYSVPHRLEVVLSRPLRQLRFTLSGELRSGLPEAIPTARYRIGDGLGDEDDYLARPEGFNGRLPPYGRLDAAVRVPFRWLDARWTLTAQAYNLLTYRNVTGRAYVPAANGVEVRERRGMPLLPLVELEMHL